MATKLAFTTLREDGGYPLFWSQHWQRLARSWHYFQNSELKGQAQLLLRLRQHFLASDDKVVRIDLLCHEGEPQFELSARALGAHHHEGMRLDVCRQHLSPRPHPSWLKSGDYSVRLNERQERQKFGFDDVVYLDQDGFITESTVSNIIWCSKNFLYAPAQSRYFLQGITTQLIQELACEQGVEIKCDRFRLADLLSAEAVWLVNAVTGPVRVAAIQEHKFAAISPQADVDQLYWQLVAIDRKNRSE